jgi:hypothetical protein
MEFYNRQTYRGEDFNESGSDSEEEDESDEEN